MGSPNVLLLVLDSVRARNVSHHGYERDTTPFIDGFADRATVHFQARAPGRWSLPSHASLFTGYHVTEHRMFDEGRRIRPGHTIWSELSDGGYATGVFSYNGYINGATDSGLDADFDTVEGYRDPPFPRAANPQGIRGQHREFLRSCLQNDRPVRSALNGLLMKLAWDYQDYVPERLRRNTLAGPTPDDEYIDLFFDWHGRRDGPWAACLNFMETHNDYLPDTEFDEWGTDRARRIQSGLEFGNWEFLGGQRPIDDLRALESLYDGAIRQADRYVERIVTTLERRGDLDDTLVVITGDHGEGFGEPDPIRPGLPTVQHVVGSHEHLLHVPLVVKYPGQNQRVDVESVVSLTDFPRVVRAVREGSYEWGEAFLPEGGGTVVASTHGLNEVNFERMREFCDDDGDRFEGETEIVYEDAADGGVKKMLNWNGHHRTLNIPDARTRRFLDENNEAFVSETFAELQDRGVIDRDDAVGGVDAGTERRLEALGYR